MTKLLTSLALASAIAVAAPAAAQVQGVATVDLEAAVGGVAALKTAQQTIQTQYKTQIDAFTARRTAAAQELQPLQQEIETLRRTSNTPPATLQAKVSAFQSREAALQQQLAPLAAPFQRPLAFAQAQVQEKLEQAIKAAMTAKRVGIVVNPQAVLAIQPSASDNITAQTP